jgi:pseudouridine-5'-phosphate glycosidase
MIPMSFSPEVSEAMKNGTPIVALESTIMGIKGWQCWNVLNNYWS